jgi:opacity protein-like surface antigen
VRTTVKIGIAGLVGLAVLVGPQGVAAGTSIGAGLNYWHALKNIDFGNFDRNGSSWFLSYQSRGDYLVGWEADFELLPDGFMASPERVYAPQAYVILGRSITAAAGIGWYYTDGEWADQPFYALRAGVEFMLIPKVSLDVMGNYRFTDWGNLNGKDINTDTIVLGAAVRLAF